MDDLRSLAVELVDFAHGYTMEFSGAPSAHAGEYDWVEERLRAAIGSDMVTFKRADGEDIDGHGWVDSTDWFDEDDEPVDLVREEWALVSRTTISYPPRDAAVVASALPPEGT